MLSYMRGTGVDRAMCAPTRGTPALGRGPDGVETWRLDCQQGSAVVVARVLLAHAQSRAGVGWCHVGSLEWLRNREIYCVSGVIESEVSRRCRMCQKLDRDAPLIPQFPYIQR